MTAIGAAVTPEIWRPQIWTPGREWRPKPLPKFSIRSWRKAKEDVITEAVGFVKSAAGGTATNASTVTATFGSAPSAASTIVALLVTSNNTAPTIPTGSGHSFTQLGGLLGVTNVFGGIFISTAGGTGTAVSYVYPSLNDGCLILYELQGIQPTTDATAVSTRGATLPNALSITTVTANDIILYLAGATGSGTTVCSFTTPGAPWTVTFNVASVSGTQNAYCSAYQIVTTPTSYSLSLAGTNTAGAVIQPFMAAFAPSVPGRRPQVMQSNVAVMRAVSR